MKRFACLRDVWTGGVKFLKTRGILLIAIIALALSGFAIWMDNVHYQEVTKPHTQHDEIYDRLARLDDKIERVQQWISTSQDLGLDTSESQINLRNAMELRDQAELAWDAARYTEADEIIKEAHGTLQEIPPPPKLFNWWLAIGPIIGVVTIGVIIWLVIRRRMALI